MEVVRVSLLVAALAGLAGCRSAPDAPPPPAAAPARPVYFTALRAFIPEALPGWTRGAAPEGSTGKYGEVAVSEVEAVFTRDGPQRLSVRIVDTSLIDRLGPAIRSAVEGASARAEEDPTAPLRLPPHALGFVRFDREERRGEANLLVGDRFVVALQADGCGDTRELRQVARAHLDLAGLAALR